MGDQPRSAAAAADGAALATFDATRLLARPGTAVEAALFWLYVAGLAWVPFWYGSNALLAWGINAIIFPALVVAYEVSLLIAGRPHPVAVRQIGVPALFFLAVVAWIVVQSTTATPHAIHSPIWSLTADALGAPVAGRISVDRDLTLQALVRLITSASVFWLALQFCRDAIMANRLIAGIAVICTAYVAYGLAIFATAPGNFLSLEPRRTASFVSSTFYNRNNFATYAGLGAVVIAGLLSKYYRHAVAAAGPARLRIAAIIETTGKGGALFIGALFIVVAALLLSGSRGGIISASFGCFVLLALTAAHGRKSAHGRRDIVLFVSVVVLVIFIGFGDTFVGKISQQGLGDDSRMAIYLLTLGSIFDAPLLGYGYGTFADVFPMFRDRSIDTSGVWLMAHNTYLEVFQGLGLVFGTLLIASVGLLALRCIVGASRRRQNATIPYIAGSVAGLIAANALVDFSLQIQAVTLTFMAVLGAGTAQSVSSQIELHD
jgi:hypothetical protein